MENLFRTFLKFPTKKLEEFSLKNPLTIHAMPGMGMVGKNALDHIIKNLHPKPEIILEIYSTAFPSNVIIMEDGTFNAPKIQFFLYQNDELDHDIIFVTGDSQPKSVMGTNNLSALITDQLNILKISFIMSLAATPVNMPRDSPKLFITVTNTDDLEYFKEMGIKNFIRGAVTGMNGLVVALSKMQHDIDGCVILSETYPHFIEDLSSSVSIVKFLNEYLRISISTSELEEKALEIKNFYDSIIRKKKKQKKSRARPEDLGYIR